MRRIVFLGMAAVLYIFLVPFITVAQNGEVGVITTVAGNGTEGFSGDDGQATSASIAGPNGVAVDTNNNLYIADFGNNRIRRVNPDGTITTVAGNGIMGFTGDGGQATGTSLNEPRGVVVDSAGNFYIADEGNNRIRRVDSSGVISTVAGTGFPSITCNTGLFSPTDVDLDASGNLYIANAGAFQVCRVDTSGTITTVAGGSLGFSGDGGLATQAALNTAQGVAVDSAGILYIADRFNHRIRQVENGIITTVAGNGSAGFSGDGGLATNAMLNMPYSVAVDTVGNLYIADAGNHRIRKVTPEGTITTVAGDGTAGFSGDGNAATDASLNFPLGVAVDSAGNIYIADIGNSRIRKVQVGSPSPDLPTVGGVVNGASFGTQPPAAGSIGSIFGTNLASSTLAGNSLPLETSLGGTSVQVNGVVAPLFFVSPGQINFQFPWEVEGQTEVSVTVTSNGVTGAPMMISLGSFDPGIFVINPEGQGAVLIANAVELAAPIGSVPGRATRPAGRGEFISIFCTGLGAVDNTPASGAAATGDPLSRTISTPSVTIGGVDATVVFSGLGPGFVGLYQVNAQVPEDAPTGDAVELVLTIGGVTSNTVTIAVQ
ncbi:MAG: hypothetical protein O7A06_02090 [Acidobacteria bacterium]|nr:hypothetical protein [Acidobacteriota bacterium]